MEISKTDIRNICRYMGDAAEYIKATTDTTRLLNRARLMNILTRKLNNKICE